MPLFKKKEKRLWRTRFRSDKFSYSSSRKKNRKIAIFKKILVSLFAFFVVYFLFFSQFFLIKKIEIKGNKSIKSSEIEKVATSKMKDAFFHFVPGNNFLFNKNEEIKNALLEKFSEIKSIKVKKVFPNSLKIEILEKDPIIIWCRLEDCYYIDNKGIIFASVDSDFKRDNNKKIIKITEQIKIGEEKKEIKIETEKIKNENNDGENENSEN